MEESTSAQTSFVQSSRVFNARVALVIAVLFLVATAFVTYGASSGFMSSEVRFSDASLRSGLAIVPASCPSSPHYEGECGSVTCTPTYFCSGDDQYYRDGSCVNDFIQTCQGGCSNGACLLQQPLSFGSFPATDPYGNSFTATGSLQIVPALVRTGDTTNLYWNAQEAASCSLSGTNGDSWTGTSSGSGGRTSSAITAQTMYTLICEALPGVLPAEVTQTQTVNIIPVFEEQ